MLGWNMYSGIHQLKSAGFNRIQVADRLGLNVKTVAKYWDMEPEDFSLILGRQGRKSILEPLRETILSWLRANPDMSGAQVADWLREHHAGLKFYDRTVRRYVSRLRKEHHLPRQSLSRQYQAAEDPAPGYQLQVDFGEWLAPTIAGRTNKIYFFTAVLSHSRYLYVEWLDTPPTAARLVGMLDNCFEYLGGMPAEIVFDQDRVVAVEENCGDIIYTFEFEKYKQFAGFSVWLCRGGDPESKGKIESSVKYVKRNFAAHRRYTGITAWNDECRDWLERTANRRVHGTTKKVPAQAFLVEQQCLRPAPHTLVDVNPIVTRTVRKDNTILYQGNRYTVPLGTYRPGLSLPIEEKDGHLIIRSELNETEVACHRLCPGKGVLVRNTNHLRDRSKAIEDLLAKLLTVLPDIPETAELLAAIRRDKGRYLRDQFGLLAQVAAQYPQDIVAEAVRYCTRRSLGSAVDCRDAAAFLAKSAEKNLPVVQVALPPHLAVKAARREVAAYSRLTGGGQDA